MLAHFSASSRALLHCKVAARFSCLVPKWGLQTIFGSNANHGHVLFEEQLTKHCWAASVQMPHVVWSDDGDGHLMVIKHIEILKANSVDTPQPALCWRVPGWYCDDLGCWSVIPVIPVGKLGKLWRPLGRWAMRWAFWNSSCHLMSFDVICHWFKMMIVYWLYCLLCTPTSILADFGLWQFFGYRIGIAVSPESEPPASTPRRSGQECWRWLVVSNMFFQLGGWSQWIDLISLGMFGSFCRKTLDRSVDSGPFRIGAMGGHIFFSVSHMPHHIIMLVASSHPFSTKVL